MFEERVIIQTKLKDNLSPNKIAAELGCSPNTVRNEIKRGTISLYNGTDLFSVTRLLMDKVFMKPIEAIPAVAAST